MSQSTLIDHGARGAREVTKAELIAIEAPPATATWFPTPHHAVLDRVSETLDGAGFRIAKSQLLVSNHDQRFFGVLDLQSDIADGVSLSIGIRNSNDQSFPIGFCCGSRVFVCSNLSFHSEVIIARRHTKFGVDRYQEALTLAVQGLHQFQVNENQRIAQLQQRELTEEAAHSLILKAFLADIVSTRTLQPVIDEWQKPSYSEFEPRTAWSLHNAFTHVLKARQRTSPQRAALQAIQLNRLLAL